MTARQLPYLDPTNIRNYTDLDRENKPNER